LGLKINWTVSPSAAVTDVGLKTRPPDPTWTGIFVASTAVARVAMVTEAREKRILKDLWVFKEGETEEEARPA